LALRDTAWISTTRSRLAADRKRLDGILARAGLKVIGGTDLFGLFEAREGLDMLDHFARVGILVRGFAAAPQHYRFGLPADESGWQRLEAVCASLK
jgi:cobalamin biosynthetic protein CobC